MSTPMEPRSLPSLSVPLFDSNAELDKHVSHDSVSGDQDNAELLAMNMEHIQDVSRWLATASLPGSIPDVVSLRESVDVLITSPRPRDEYVKPLLRVVRGPKAVWEVATVGRHHHGLGVHSMPCREEYANMAGDCT